jgi:hypothetical protein
VVESPCVMEHTISSVKTNPIFFSLVGALIHPVHQRCTKLLRDRRTLKLGLSGDGITVDLITSSYHTVQCLGVVSENHILP